MNNVSDRIGEYFPIIIKMLKYVSIAGFIYCLYGVSVGVIKNYQLWINPINTEGKIVGYKKVFIRNNFDNSSNAFGTKLPIVEFKDKKGNVNRVVGRFGDETTRKGDKVSVLYSEKDSKNSIINKGFFNNWLDIFIYLFGLIGFFLGVKRFTNLTGKTERRLD